MIRVLVVGSGAREHALAWACHQSDLPEEVLCAPGNGGTAAIVENVPVDAVDVDGIVRLAVERKVELVVVGPDAAVAAGLADACAAAGIACFGPTRAAGRVEASKRFAKELMAEAGIPTARWTAGGAGDRTRLHGFAEDLGGACVVKADGLALGKGVVVCDDAAQARAAIDACLVEGRFGEAGASVVVEERLVGRELSVFALTDGTGVRLLPAACDYKRAFDGDQGPNTGGMGSYAPADVDDTEALLFDALVQVVQPCVDALRARDTPYRGCLYAGLMLTDDGLRVLEFNARFGDPEAQVVIPLVAEDLVELLGACAVGGLPTGLVRLHHGAAVGVVAASDGYPGEVATGHVVRGLDGLDRHALCFHAGTVRDPDGTVRTAGGRVLTVVGRGHDLEAARRHAYANLAHVRFDGMRSRSDIAMVGQNAVGA